MSPYHHHYGASGEMKVQEKNVLAAVEGQQGVDGQEQRSDGSGGGGVSGAGASPEHSGTPG